MHGCSDSLVPGGKFRGIFFCTKYQKLNKRQNKRQNLNQRQNKCQNLNKRQNKRNAVDDSKFTSKMTLKTVNDAEIVNTTFCILIMSEYAASF
jgi:hypothetical protein